MTLRRTLLSAATLLTLLPSLAGCNLVHAKEGAVPTGPMKKISIGRLDLQVPADAELKMTGQVKEVRLSLDHLPAGQTFAAAWDARVKKIGSGSGNDPNPGHTVIRKTYPATADHGQVYYEQGKDPQILVVVERWQMVGNILVKGREEFEPKFLLDVERDMEAVFGHMSLQAPATREDFAIGPVTVHQTSQGGAESTDASVAMALPVGDSGKLVPITLKVTSQVLSSPGSITVLSRAKGPAQHTGDPDYDAKLLRAARRSAAGLEGEESVLTLSKKGGPAGSLRAEWGTPGKPGDDRAPQTELRFGGNGEQLSVPELLGYWDAILASLKYRQ